MKSLLLSIFLFTSSFSLVFSADSMESYFQKAKQAQQALELKAAEIHLKNAVKFYPKSPLPHIKMAEYYVHIGQGNLAEIEIKNAIKYKAKASDLLVLKLKNHLIQGQFTQITEQNTPLLNMPINQIARVRALQGLAYLNQNKVDQAKPLFNRAIRLAPNELEVQVATARLYLLEDKKAEAKQLIDQLHQQHPNIVDVLLLVGNLYRDEQDYEKAYQAFENASKIQSGNIAGWLGMVTSLVGQNKYDEADKRIKNVLDLNPQFELGNYLQALIAYRLGNQAKARQAISLILKNNPKHQGILWIAGALDYRKRRYDDAQKNLEAYLKHNPSHYQSSKMLAAIYIKKKREQDAIKLLQPYKEYWDNIAYSILGDAYKQLGQAQKSSQLYAKAAELTPKDQRLQSKLLMNKLSRGEDISAEVADEQFENLKGVGFPKITQLLLKKETDKAIEVINGYLKKNKKEPELYQLLGHAYLQKNNLKQAETQYKKALSLDIDFIAAYLSLAQIHLARNKNEFARREYQQILVIQPKHEIAILNMAKLYQLEKNYPEMLKSLNKARNNNDYSTTPRLLLNQYYLATKDTKKALEITQELVDAYPEKIQFLKLHADNLYANKELDFAILIYKKIVKLKPNSAQAYFWLGSAEFIWNDNDNARRHIQKSLQLDSNNFIAQVMLIKIDLKQRKLAGTLTRANELVKNFPKNALSYETLGDVQLAYKKVQAAIASYQKSFDIKPKNPLIMTKLARVNAISGNIKQSIVIFNNWLDKNPEDIKSRMTLALIYQQTKQIDLAQKHYELILKQQPKNIDVINNLALIYEQQKDPRSFEFAEVAYSLAPTDVNVIDTLGWMLVNNGELQRGLGLLKQAAKLAPSELDIVYHYAVALEKSGKKVVAKKELNIITTMTGKFENREKAIVLLKKLNQKL